MSKATPQTLPRKERLRKRAEIDIVFRRGSMAKGRWLMVRAMPNGLGFSRAAVAIGKAVGNAVMRNRLRRRLRAAYRALKCLLPSGWDWVLQCRADAADVAFAELAADMEATVRRALIMAKG